MRRLAGIWIIAFSVTVILLTAAPARVQAIGIGAVENVVRRILEALNITSGGVYSGLAGHDGTAITFNASVAAPQITFPSGVAGQINGGTGQTLTINAGTILTLAAGGTTFLSYNFGAGVTDAAKVIRFGNNLGIWYGSGNGRVTFDGTDWIFNNAAASRTVFQSNGADQFEISSVGVVVSGSLTFADGAGAVPHGKGPSDQPFAHQPGSGQLLVLRDEGGTDQLTVNVDGTLDFRGIAGVSTQGGTSLRDTTIATAALTLGASQVRGQGYGNEGSTSTTIVTLPAAVVGERAQFAATDGSDKLRIQCAGTDTITVNGATSSAGGYAEADIPGVDSIVSLCVYVAGEWTACHVSGPWAIYNGSAAIPATSLHAEYYITTANGGTTGAITGGTPVEVAGTATAGDTRGFTITTSSGGRATYEGAAPKSFMVTVSFACTTNASNHVVKLYVAKSGVVEAASEMSRKIGTGSDQGSWTTTEVLTLTTGQYIEVFVDSVGSSTDTVTVENLTVAIVGVSNH